MAIIDMRKIEKKYVGLWVALNESRTRVAGCGRTIEIALSEAKKKGIKDPILTKIPSENLGYLL
ncbi:MAG: hypothetical protein A3I73_01435 [Omnitrophica bacterium RIFCSPLOWO2_02_FULL_45_16]|nr:MAG: hypothetical protein A3C51_03150 [Omnitrophica bacterium RIFCSPHIGHO2_02_FULL_46_20]OGW93140.1 MAG: hypothetical protein A3K16_02775 [Omnitrophica bacterium RIFCSPLOWO2_01_FULL_45_24]OGW93969.1 MAG: hypothetical protein A3G36_01875 [Omnitrophica bacterium RIFCSPLOWO2_12_FULL_45_13]OGX01203.1 MAG: hypothetical protein A3I73_01435 [Omnitrophica bacterium RIFCSPLOWO2_02_FULL_45_16]